MQVENHKEEAPFAHYAELFRNLNPAAVAARLSDVRWDGKEFTLSLLGRAFAIVHPDYAIRALDGGALPPLPSQTFLLRYLLESKDVVWQGQWKTFREMPWGEMYIKPYTGRVLTRAAFTFGTHLWDSPEGHPVTVPSVFHGHLRVLFLRRAFACFPATFYWLDM